MQRFLASPPRFECRKKSFSHFPHLFSVSSWRHEKLSLQHPFLSYDVYPRKVPVDNWRANRMRKFIDSKLEIWDSKEITTVVNCMTSLCLYQLCLSSIINKTSLLCCVLSHHILIGELLWWNTINYAKIAVVVLWTSIGESYWQLNNQSIDRSNQLIPYNFSKLVMQFGMKLIMRARQRLENMLEDKRKS